MAVRIPLVMNAGQIQQLQSGDTIAGGSGTTPTGTGLRHVVAGVEAAAASLAVTADLTDANVTYAKIQNVSATDKVLGRSSAGAGVVEEIACTANGRTVLSGGVLPPAQMPALTGDVTNSAGALATTIAAGAVSVDKMALAARPNQNFLINGGFDLIQRQVTPGTYTTYATDKYCADRWRLCSQTASAQVKQFDGTGVSGLVSKNYLGIKQITGAGKFMLVQMLENVDTVPRLNRTYTFQCKMKASANKTIRIAVVELASAGTADSIPATFVSSWNVNTADPTLGTNLALVQFSTGCSVLSASWTQFSVSYTAPTNSKNLGVMIWSDSQMAINDEVYIAECGLFDGGSLRDWLPRLATDELAMCQRYCYVMRSDATATFATAGSARGSSTSTVRAVISLPTVMRVTPSMTVTVADWAVLDNVTNPVCTAITVTPTAATSRLVRLDITVAGTPFTISFAYQIQATAADKLMIFEAEL